MALFQGLSAFSLTPTDPAGQVQVDLLCAQLERIAAAEVDSVGLLGSTGGYAYLSRAERLRAVKAAAGCLRGRVPLMVGVGALTTAEAQGLARDAQEAGADGLLLAPMSYTPLTEEEVFRHFQAVAEVTELPLCIYNNPGTTHFTFSEGLIARLAALPKIAAVKMPAAKDGDFAGEIARLRAAAGGLSVGYSGDWFAADALLAGADAFYSVAAGLLPVAALRLVRAAQAGDAGRTREVDAAFGPLWALFKEFGSFRVMFVLADILSLGRFDPPRPILPLGPDARTRIEAALHMLAA
jgi:4-hydroxy-tetrahydrodipicolinate synthase